jgi:hypothetical protein
VTDGCALADSFWENCFGGKITLVLDFALGEYLLCIAYGVLLDWRSSAWDYPGTGTIARALLHLQWQGECSMLVRYQVHNAAKRFWHRYIPTLAGGAHFAP